MNETRTVTVHGRPTKLTLDTEFWTGLEEIGRREGFTVDELVEAMELRRRGIVSLPRMIEACSVAYFRQAATDRPDIGIILGEI